MLNLGLKKSGATSEAEQFGQYVIEKREDGCAWELGRGAMGVTYRALDTSLQRAVALKIIGLERAPNAEAARERFLREARAAASLRHPNIATVYQFGIHEESGQCFYAMELIEGETLEERVQRHGPLDVPTTIEIARQVTSALLAAEARRLVHRDIKPANLMMIAGADTDFTIKVIDFGVAKALAETSDPRFATQGGFIGTPAFASPEQWANRSVDVRSDIYSLGATLWYLLTGRTPFGEPDANGNSAPPPVEQLKAANVPSRFSALLLSMVAREAGARPDVHALAGKLESLQRRERRKRTRRFATAVALLVALVAGILLSRRPVVENALPEKSIAVLPFESFGDEKENAYFANGIQDDVLTNLAKVADLKVISRRSVMQYRGKGRNPHEIGQALKVAHVLEGSIRRAGGRVRVNAQLIDTRTDTQIWGEQYDRDLADVFSIQSELAERIVARLQATLSPVEKAAIEAPPTRDLQAYDLYLRAKEVIFQLPSATFEADITRAIDLLNQAVARDPKFALAYALLCRAHVDFFWESGRAPAHLEQARLSAEAASRLAPDSGETRFARGFYFFHGLEDNARALAEFTIAMRQLPNNAEVFTWSGILERRMALWTEAVRDLEKAMELDPHNALPPFDLSVTYEMLRNYAEAQRTIDRALIAIPQRANPLLARKAEIALLAADSKACRAILQSLPADYQQGGFIPYLWARLALWNRDYAEADRVLAAVPRKDASTFTKAWIARDQAFVAHAAGDAATMQRAMHSARTIWEAQLQEAGDKSESLSYLALWDAAMGDKQSAFNEAQQAVELRPLSRDASNAPDLLLRQALVYAWCGERDLAFRQLTMLAKVPGGFSAGEIKLNPAWDSLRDDPRFKELLKQGGLLQAPLPPTAALPATSVPDTDAERKSSTSIAVLPFENLNGDRSNEYLASGIHGDVLANLSRLGQLKVISANSVLPYKNTQGSAREIGSALGVRTVLKGSVQRVGSRARINVQVIDTTNDAQIWAESFDREVTDIFSVQSDLAARIAGALQVKLSPAERASMEKPPTRDAEAYDFYLRGRALLDGIASLGNREENLSNAIDLLNRAVARDPDFALGYCFLARLHLARFRLLANEPARLALVKSNLEIALRLAPDLGEAHLVKGMYFYWGVVDPEKAAAEFAIARATLPNNSECFHLSGLLERRLGRWSDGLHDLRKAVSLDPKNATARTDLASTYYLTRNFAEADHIFDEAITALPEHENYFRLKKAQVALMKGDLKTCRAGLEALPPDYEYDGFVGYHRALLALRLRDFAGADRILAETPAKLGRKKTEWWVVRDQAFVARAEGDAAKTKAALQAALQFWESDMRRKKPDDAGVLCTIAQFHAGLGRKEEALREAHRAVELRPIAADAVDGPAFATIEALVSAWCGERDRALKQLASLAKLPSGPDPGDLKFNPAWDALRGDPRLDAVIAAASEPIKIE